METTYTKDELIKALDVTFTYWKKNKARILEYLRSICNELIIEGNRTNCIFIFKEMREEIIPIKNDIRNIRKVRKESAYPDTLIKIIREFPIQNYVNLSRISKEEEKIKELHYKDSTHYCNVRYYMRELCGSIKPDQWGNFEGGSRGTIERKAWCKYYEKEKVFREMEEEELKIFFSLMEKSKEEYDKKLLELWNEYRQGSISREEYLEECGGITNMSFLDGEWKFMKEYGYRPYYVPVYILGVKFEDAQQ